MENIITGNGWEIISGWEYEDKRGLYYNGNLVTSFLSKEDCSDSKYNIYIYANLADGKCYLKLGKMKDNVIIRYKGYQDMNNPAMCVIALYETNFGDEPIHKALQNTEAIINAYKWQESSENNNTDENYLMFSESSVKKFTDEVEGIIQSKNVKVKDQPLYSDIQDLVIDIFSKVTNTNKFWTILNLCTRWGKTRTNLSLCEIFNYKHRISIMCSYVGTVRNSYKNAIDTIKCYNDYFRFYDLNTEIDFNEVIDFLNNNENNHVMFYLALTGDDDTFENRIKILNNKLLQDYSKLMFIEEADFGAHCENQIKKINKLKEKYNIAYTFVTTGTGFDKIQKIVENDYNIFVKEYLYDVL